MCSYATFSYSCRSCRSFSRSRLFLCSSRVLSLSKSPITPAISSLSFLSNEQPAVTFCNVKQCKLNYYIGLKVFSRKTWVSWHQKCIPFWILMKQEMMGWQWHLLDHMQIICTSLQTDNHRPDTLRAAQPTASKDLS